MKKILNIILCASFAFSTNVGQAAITSHQIDPPHSVNTTLDIILVENAAKAGAITRVIEGGARDCAQIPLDDRTACVADVLRDASKTSRSVRFGANKTTRALGRAASKMKRLADDGSEASFAKGREIIVNLNQEILGIAKKRPKAYRRYQIEVAESVLSLTKPLRNGKS